MGGAANRNPKCQSRNPAYLTRSRPGRPSTVGTCRLSRLGGRRTQHSPGTIRVGGAAMPIHDWTRVTAGTWHAFHLGERQDLISLLLGDSRFDGDVILRQGRRSFQSGFVLLHLLGGDSNAIGILAMEAFHDRVPALPGHS